MIPTCHYPGTIMWPYLGWLYYSCPNDVSKWNDPDGDCQIVYSDILSNQLLRIVLPISHICAFTRFSYYCSFHFSLPNDESYMNDYDGFS